ncbi:hypothetical protein EK599_07760 [Vibrio sp. T187]|uniref:hypothetical protein n=1 Tax=Vibrio TaxID=662 RepID=UPI0010C97385|nr:MULTISPECIES: hypothetical protein [Vibrio]MBW3695588.1 hypothetical protein [Vibrio sp. T187]
MRLKTFLCSTSLLIIGGLVSFSATASSFTNEQLCKAGLSLAIEKQPRAIKATAGKTNQKVLLDVKDGSKDWDYRCMVNRANKTIKLDARETKRNDKFLGQAIRYDVADAKRSVKVTMKKRKGQGLISESFTQIQLK